MMNSILSLAVADVPYSAEKTVAAAKPGIVFAQQTTTEPMFRIANRVAISLEPGEQVIACTGVREGDPSGSFAAHFALALARLGRGPILLVDANFQKKPLLEPRTHMLGFVNLLSGEEDLDSAVQRTDVDGLDVLTAGDTTKLRPSMLSSSRMSMLIKSLRQYSLVIMDVGALSENAESMVMASKADAIVATATSGERTRREVAQLKTETSLLAARFLGIVLTDVR